MIHQEDVWKYISNRYRRTDMVAKHFGLTTEQANHVLQKLLRYGHAVKEKRGGQYCYWKAVSDCPPRHNAYEVNAKWDRENEVLMYVVFSVGTVYKAEIMHKTGLSEWKVLNTLKSLESQGLVRKVGTKGWMAVRQ